MGARRWRLFVDHAGEGRVGREDHHLFAIPGLHAELAQAVQVHQPGYEHLAGATRHDVRDPAAFFAELDLPVAVSGLPRCLVGPAEVVDPPALLPAAVLDPGSGRLRLRELARHHVIEHYRGKSLRCADCVEDDRCDGIRINMVRDQGLKLASPIGDQEASGSTGTNSSKP